MPSRLSFEEVENFVAEAFDGRNVELWPIGDRRLNEHIDLANSWKALLRDRDNWKDQLVRLWEPLTQFLPATCLILMRKVADIFLVVEDAEPRALLYLFRLGADCYGHIGYRPMEDYAFDNVPQVVKPLLEAFYRVHNGWVDVFSGDSGPLPTEYFEYLSEDPKEPSTFFATFSKGTQFVGFDSRERSPKAFSVWPDEGEVRPVGDYWSFLDEEISDLLAEYD